MRVTIIKHGPKEGLGSFEDAILDAGHEIDLIDATVANTSDWQRARVAPALIVMGGPMGVYEADQHTFLGAELELLRERIAKDLPTLGICLGSQLLAQAAGSPVRNSGRREVGWFEVQPLGAAEGDPLLAGLNWSSPVFHWHQDTFDTPPGAVRLLRSERFAQQGFRLSPRIYGLQFHPEVTPHEMREWIEAEPNYPYGRADGVQSIDELHGSAGRFGPAMVELSKRLIQRFLGLAGA